MKVIIPELPEEMEVVPQLCRHLQTRDRRNLRLLDCDEELDQCVSASDLPIEVEEVWRSNLDVEFKKIHWAVNHGYRILALDTEFPGSPYVPDGVSVDFRNRDCEDHYRVMKMNVERLKIIQVGITLTDEYGNLPHFGSGKRVIWQFNFFDFDVERDGCSNEAVSLLKSRGIDFERLKKFGIPSARFAYLMARYGLVGPLRRHITWITFQGGVDLAYLMKMFSTNGLPNELRGFKSCISYFFGSLVFDVKYMMRHCRLYGGLDKVATTLKIKREAGESHTAGSDSLLTIMVFQQLQQEQLYFPQPLSNFAGKIHNFVQSEFSKLFEN